MSVGHGSPKIVPANGLGITELTVNLNILSPRALTSNGKVASALFQFFDPAIFVVCDPETNKIYAVSDLQIQQDIRDMETLVTLDYWMKFSTTSIGRGLLYYWTILDALSPLEVDLTTRQSMAQFVDRFAGHQIIIDQATAQVWIYKYAVPSEFTDMMAAVTPDAVIQLVDKTPAGGLPFE